MKKTTSIILILILSILVMLSTYCIAFEYGHECDHDHDECPICHLVSQCEQTLHQLKTAYASTLYVNISLLFVIVQIYYFATIVLSNSLVSNKVRLNN